MQNLKVATCDRQSFRTRLASEAQQAGEKSAIAFRESYDGSEFEILGIPKRISRCARNDGRGMRSFDLPAQLMNVELGAERVALGILQRAFA
jgi:hypothetical protein